MSVNFKRVPPLMRDLEIQAIASAMELWVRRVGG